MRADDIDDEDEFGEAGYQNAIGLNRFTLNILGTWPELSPKERAHSKNLHVPFTICFLFAAMIAPQIYALVLVINNLPLVVENAVTLCAGLTSTFQLFFFYKNIPSFSAILVTMKSEWLTRKNHDEREIMLKFGNRGRNYTIGGFVLMSFTVAGVTMGPHVGGAFRELNNITDRGDRLLPLQTYYPYDYSISPYFEISYISQMISGIWTALIFTGVLNFFSALVFHVCGQMEIIATKLKNLKLQMKSKKCSSLCPKLFILKNFKETIQNHVHLIRTLDVIERSFKMIILVEFCSLTVINCSLGFLIVNTFDNESLPISRVIVLSGALVNILMHTFVYCLAGETVERYSHEMFNGLCESDWHLFPPYLTMDICFALTRLEHPIRLGLNGIFYLNLETFCQIVKTSAGYMSMLMAVKD